MEPPLDLPGTTCYEDTSAADDDRFRCPISYHEFAIRVAGPAQYDAQQRIAAQYARLATS